VYNLPLTHQSSDHIRLLAFFFSLFYAENTISQIVLFGNWHYLQASSSTLY